MDELEALANAIRAAENRLERTITIRRAAENEKAYVVGWPDGMCVTGSRTRIDWADNAFVVGREGLANHFRQVIDLKHFPRQTGAPTVMDFKAMLDIAIESQQAGLKCMKAVIGEMLRASGLPLTGLALRRVL